MPDTQRLPRWTYALLFLLFTAALACTNWGAIGAVNHEVSDFAANTLLIQDAKQLHLIYGNYSRVGFNHPGPAILQVLAFGELVFHDLLHLVPSPFSAQLLAADMYNAAWLVLIVAMVRRMTGKLLPALLFAALALLVFAYGDYQIVGGVWFPHLYVLPYAAMLVAIARLVHGQVDTLKALAVTSGFLINGHASFVPMLGVILVLVLAANTLVSRRRRENIILTRAWLARNGRALAAAVGILFLFFVPLIIATIKDFPGPVRDYVSFGSGNKGHSFMEALKFVGVYWGFGPAATAHGAAIWGVLLAVLLFLSLRGPQDGFKRGARALGIVFVAATLALVLYAKVGVDMLDQTYIALFYYSVPALAAGLLALFAWHAVGWKGRDAAAAVLAVLALAASWHWVSKPPTYAYFYDHAQVTELYKQMRALPGQGRIVLDLENNPQNWGEVWGNTLGLLAYAKRQGVDLACVNENWHISFSRRAKCRPDEVASNRRYFVRQTGAPDPERGEPDVDALGLSFYKAGATPRPFAYVTVKEQPDYFKRILGKGWSVVEGDFVWTNGPVAEIDLPADPQRPRMLTLDMGSFIPAYEVRLHVQGTANGKPAGRWEFYATEIRRRITLDLGADPGAPQHIELKIDKPVTPAQYNISPDTRLLGLSLYGIKKDTHD